MAYEQWPAAARTLAGALDRAVRALAAADLDGFEQARGDLRRVDPDVLGVLLGSITEALIERSYPDGLDSDDAERVLGECARTAAGFDEYDPDQAAVALLGALGLLDPATAPAAAQPVVIAHGLVLVACLLPTPKQLPALIDAALAEVQRAQSVEMP